MTKQKIRPARWAAALDKANESVAALVELQEQYQEWRDNLPENLESSALAEKLDEVTQVDLQSAQASLEEAEGVELPLGFGRD